jgi:hypothetical protein
MPAGRALIVIVVTLLVWAVLYAPELKRSAEAGDVGTRRSVSLALLDPLVWLTDHTGLTVAANAAARAAGRDPNAEVGGVDVGVDPLPPEPSGSPKPHEHVVHDTPVRAPTPDNQLRVAVVGDSLAQGVGFAADSVFKPFWAEVFKQGRISTGLARLDYFNWLGEMQTIVDRADPDLVMVMIGENDDQNLLNPDGSTEQDIGTFDWAAHYEDRVERFAKIATSAGGHVVWIGMPNGRDQSRWPLIQRQNEIYESVADRLPNVAYYDTWDAFAAPDGGYTAFYRESSSADIREIRAPDGVHFNSDGYRLVMLKAAQMATQAFDLDTKTYG